MPKVSIIVPVYKAEKYIHRCIDSILAQTFTDWELLLVDDGGPDRSGEICDEYAKKDKRIRVFHKENGGVSSARNLGIDKAEGEWIAFVDSDDMLEKSYLLDFPIEECKADLYIQGYKKIKNGKVIEVKNLLCKENSFECIVASAEDNNIINSPCFKLFRTSIIKDNNIRFDTQLSIGEDHLFSLQYLFCIKNIGYTHASGYYYMLKDEESLTNRILPIDEFLYYTCECRKLHKEICQRYGNNISLRSAFDYRLLNCVIRLLKDFYKSDGELKQYKCLRKAIANVVGHHHLYIKKQYRLFMFSFLHIPCAVGYVIFKRYFYAE